MTAAPRDLARPVVMSDRIQMRAPASLVPYANNARTHSAAQIAKVVRSIEEFGFTSPILVDGAAGVIAGHARLAAALELGLERVPVIELAHLTDAQKRAYILADNRLALDAGWDENLLAAELEALSADGFSLESTGFSDEELRGLLEPGGADDDFDTTPAKAEVSARGDLWVLGEHRVLCGDATAAEDVTRILAGGGPSLMVTDPPYGVDYDPAWRNEAAKNGDLAYAASRVGPVENDDRMDWSAAWQLFPGSVVYCWHAGRHASVVQEHLAAAGFEVRNQIIWAKSNFPISRGHYHWRHEPCWYAVRRGSSAQWIGDRKQTTLWEINLDRNVEGGHSTQKPLECMARPIRNHDGDVYDPFLGSGTTLVAAEKLSRRCFAIEISPAYVDVSIRRWQSATGGAAVLDGDGRTFDVIALERAAGATA